MGLGVKKNSGTLLLSGSKMCAFRSIIDNYNTHHHQSHNHNTVSIIVQY